MKVRIFAHLLLHNSRLSTARCLESLLSQDGFAAGENLKILVTDNASQNSIYEELRARYGDRAEFGRNELNLGFCGAHNIAAQRFLDEGLDYFLVLNPDVLLEPDCLQQLVAGLQSEQQCGSATPLLLRCDHELMPLQPKVVDAAGMWMSSGLRHFDRGSGQKLDQRFEKNAYVFGGSGACLLMSRKFVAEMAECFSKPGDRKCELFDERFFAYREDADLAWRAQSMGWKCIYVSSAIAYHERRVTPDNRAALPAALNSYSVRNRFLMQFNNYRFDLGWAVFWKGIVIRNLVVIFGVVLFEWKSLGGLMEVFTGIPGSLRRRRDFFTKHRDRLRPDISKWFSDGIYVEPVK